MTELALDPSIANAGAPKDSWSDAALVRYCLRGNEEAWAVLLDRYKRLIYSIPLKYGFSTDEAGDIFQETCVELLSALPRLREPQALPKWLMQVTSHKCGHLKQHERRSEAPRREADASLLDEVADSRRLSDEVLLEAEREQTLRDACSALPPRCRSLVQMLFFETPARPYAEIAKTLQIACGSIGFIRGRCLQRLRATLRTHGMR